MVIQANPARRAHRSAKLCAFQVKNPTGRKAPSSSKDPSTRQYVAERAAVRALTRFGLKAGSAIAIGTNRPSRGRSCKVKQICSDSLNNDSHPKSIVQDRVPTA